MTGQPGLDFSFSGLKTAVVLAAGRQVLDDQTVADIAHGFEDAAVDTLILKSRAALEATGHARLVVAGGVGANRKLRARLAALGRETGTHVHFPRPEFCTDNGAMIAYAGWLRLRDAPRDLAFGVRPRWGLADLGAVTAGRPAT